MENFVSFDDHTRMQIINVRYLFFHINLLLVPGVPTFPELCLVLLVGVRRG